MKRKIVLFISVLLIALACNETKQGNAISPKKAGVKVSIMYPNDLSKNFDIEYYSKKHMPMVADLFGEKLIDYSIDKGLSGRTPEDSITYVAIGYFYFDELSDYQEVFGPNAEQILSDIPNYTNIRPVVQISEIVK